MSAGLLTAHSWWQSNSDFLFDGSLGIRALLALSVAIPLYCGFVSLSSAAFMGIGAYSATLLVQVSGLPFPLALMGAGLAPVAIAVLIGWPASRLGGVQLALVTLASGAAFETLLRRFAGTATAPGLGDMSRSGVPFEIVLALVVAGCGLHRLRHSRFGLAWAAVRQDEVAAMVAGIDVPLARLIALALSAALAGLAGGLEAHREPFLMPADYGLGAALENLGMAVLGGTAGVAGPLLGALALGWLPVALALPSELRVGLNGAVLIVVVLVLPDGLYDPTRLRRALRRA